MKLLITDNTVIKRAMVSRMSTKTSMESGKITNICSISMRFHIMMCIMTHMQSPMMHHTHSLMVHTQLHMMYTQLLMTHTTQRSIMIRILLHTMHIIQLLTMYMDME